MKKMLKGIEDIQEFEKLIEGGIKVQLVSHKQSIKEGKEIIEYKTVLKDKDNVLSPGFIYHVYTWNVGENPVYEGFDDLDKGIAKCIDGSYIRGAFINGEEEGNYMIVGEDEFEGGYNPSKELDFEKEREKIRCGEDNINSFINKKYTNIIVKYINKSDMSLTYGKEYEVISIEDGMYRIVDNTDEDYLFSSKDFEIVEE